MTAPTTHLILFTRAPVAGATKSRLAVDVGSEAARDFHVACLLDLIDTAVEWQSASSTRVHAFVTPADSAPVFRAAGIAWPKGFQVRDQGDGSLGVRMSRALATVLAEAPGAAVLVGSDLPLLHVGILGAAAKTLETADVVFGPSHDGGYYLVGLKQPAPSLFQGQPWGGASVLAATVSAAQALGLRTAQVAPLPDVDVVGDIADVLAHPLAGTLPHRRALGLLRAWIASGRINPLR